MEEALCLAEAQSVSVVIVVAVVVEHGTSGGQVAAPIARSILERYFEKKGEPSAATRSIRPTRSEGGSIAEN